MLLFGWISGLLCLYEHFVVTCETVEGWICYVDFIQLCVLQILILFANDAEHEATCRPLFIAVCARTLQVLNTGRFEVACHLLTL